MERFTLKGHVLPDCYDISYDISPTIEWPAANDAEKATIRVTLKGSAITVACEVAVT